MSQDPKVRVGPYDVRTNRFYVEVEGGIWSMNRQELFAYLSGSVARGAFVGEYGRRLKTNAVGVPGDGPRKSTELPAHLRRGFIGLHTLDWPKRRFRGALQALLANDWEKLYYGTFEEIQEDPDGKD